MCPPVICPSCSKKTYHKGSCENPCCQFDPVDSRWEEPGPLSADEFFASATAANVAVWKLPTPFPALRIVSPNLADVDEFAERCGFRGSFFNMKADPSDVFSEEQHGFDLVKDKARPYLDHLDQEIGHARLAT